MSWFCNTNEAKEHKKNCTKNPNYCDECVWIDESGLAMGRYGKEIKDINNESDVSVQEKVQFINLVNRSSDAFESYEDKLTFIKKVFKIGE